MASRKVIKLHHPEYRLTQRYDLADKSNTCNSKRICLLKYFPKYYKRLDLKISMKDWPLLYKLRLIKIIQHFAISQVDNISNAFLSGFEQKIFRNKRKSVRSLPVFNTRAVFDQAKAKPQISRFFPKITNLDIYGIRDLNFNGREVMFIDRALEQKILQSYNYFWRGFRNLRHLELSNVTSYSWFLIKEMNSVPLFLSRLKILKLWLIIPLISTDLSRPRNVLYQLAKNENFLRHLTHLECEKFEGLQYYDELMSGLLAQCVNLISLNFPIGRQADYYSSRDEIYKECEEFKVLQQIGRMSSLQILTVSVYGIKTLIKHFSLPKSLQKIELNVLNTFSDLTLLDLFDSEFFGHWKELSQLYILKIKMRRAVKSNDLLHKFVLPLLETTQNLRKFSLILEDSPSICSAKWESLDLSLFNERVIALKQLESFKVSNYSIFSQYLPEKTFEFINLNPQKWIFLSHMKKINVIGPFSEEFDFKSFLERCDVKIPTKKRVKLSTLTFDSVETFLECIEAANKIVSFGNIRLALDIILPIQNLEETLGYFKEPITLERNLMVSLNVAVKSKGWRPNMNHVIEPNLAALKIIFGDFKVQVTQSR